MPIIRIDDKEFELDLLSTEAKEQLATLQFVDAELQHLQAQLAVYQTARIAYTNALKQSLPQDAGMPQG